MYADVSEESRYMLRNEGVRENELLIWHSNCLTGPMNDSNVLEHSNVVFGVRTARPLTWIPKCEYDYNLSI
jgi:hypothetical protein